MPQKKAEECECDCAGVGQVGWAGVLTQFVFFGGMGAYLIVAGASLLAGLNQSKSGSCCLPPWKICPHVTTGAVPPLYPSPDRPGLCDLSLGGTADPAKIAAILNCPAAVNMTFCDKGVDHSDFCHSSTSGGLILATAIMTIITACFPLFWLHFTFWTQSSVKHCLCGMTFIWMNALLFVLIIIGAISLHQITEARSFARDASVCGVACEFSVQSATFQKSVNGSVCPWVNGEGRDNVAQVFEWIGDTDAMRRPAIAIIVFASTVLLISVGLFCGWLIEGLCETGTEYTARGVRWFAAFLDGETWSCQLEGVRSKAGPTQQVAAYRQPEPEREGAPAPAAVPRHLDRLSNQDIVSALRDARDTDEEAGALGGEPEK